MTDFGALLTNPHVWTQFPHVFFAGITTAGFFVLGISAYHLARKSQDRDLFLRSFRMAAIYASDRRGIGRPRRPPPGPAHLRGPADEDGRRRRAVEQRRPGPPVAVRHQPGHVRAAFTIEIPYMLSFLAFNRFSGKVAGINELPGPV